MLTPMLFITSSNLSQLSTLIATFQSPDGEHIATDYFYVEIKLVDISINSW